jgi:hypothetical protein
MLHLKKLHFGKEKKTERLGMNGLQYDMWKEMVRMEAIRLPKHINHWSANNLRTF